MNKLESLHSRMLCVKLKLVQWFWRRRWDCENSQTHGRTDRRTDRMSERQTDDGPEVIRKAHLSFQLRWAKNISTINQFVRLETIIRYAFVHREHAGSIFFSLEKAYDTTWKYDILKDLRNINGLKGHLPNFIKNVPGNRNF